MHAAEYHIFQVIKLSLTRVRIALGTQQGYLEVGL
jgi:hypothetical protein